jgi:hypothetical protein
MPTKDGQYNLLDSYQQHSGCLLQIEGKLTVVGKLVKEKPFAPGEFPVTWGSAHEAAAGLVRFTLDWFVCPLLGLADPEAEQWSKAEWLLVAHSKKLAGLRNLLPDRVATLVACIRRERAKLLGQMALESELAIGEQSADTGSVTEKSGKRRAKLPVPLDAQALGVFIEHPDWTKKKIAAHLECHEKSLCPDRCPKLAAAIAAHKSHIDPGRRRVRGSKDAEGNLEAWNHG